MCRQNRAAKKVTCSPFLAPGRIQNNQCPLKTLHKFLAAPKILGINHLWVEHFFGVDR